MAAANPARAANWKNRIVLILDLHLAKQNFYFFLCSKFHTSESKLRRQTITTTKRGERREVVHLKYELCLYFPSEFEPRHQNPGTQPWDCFMRLPNHSNVSMIHERDVASKPCPETWSRCTWQSLRKFQGKWLGKRKDAMVWWEPQDKLLEASQRAHRSGVSNLPDTGCNFRAREKKEPRKEISNNLKCPAYCIAWITESCYIHRHALEMCNLRKSCTRPGAPTKQHALSACRQRDGRTLYLDETYLSCWWVLG